MTATYPKEPTVSTSPDLIDHTPTDLPKRRLRLKECVKYGCGRSGDRLVFDYHDPRTGELVAQKIKAPGKKFSWVGDKPRAGLYGQHLWKAGSGGRGGLILTEGEIDALSMAQVNDCQFPVVSLNDGAGNAVRTVKEHLAWIEGFEKVVLMFDNDEPGREATLGVSQLLSPGKAHAWRPELKDPNEYLLAGRSAELKNLFWQAPEFRPDGLMRGDALWDRVVNTPIPAAVEYPYPALQAKTLGLREGEIVTLCGGPASGKTTLAKELLVHLALEGHRVGVVSLEENERETMLGLLTALTDRRLMLEKDLDIASLKEDWDRISDRVSLYSHAGRATDAKAINSYTRFMAQGDGCRFVLVDNLSVVVASSTGDNERRLIDIIMKEQVGLVGQTGATIMNVVHLKRPGDGDGYSEGRVPRLEDLRGSGMLEAFSRDVIGVSRDLSRDDGIASLWTLKCRFTGEAGFSGNMRYDRNTGRLTEAGDWVPE